MKAAQAERLHKKQTLQEDRLDLEGKKISRQSVAEVCAVTHSVEVDLVLQFNCALAQQASSLYSALAQGVVTRLAVQQHLQPLQQL
jgi:hypothetical protein